MTHTKDRIFSFLPGILLAIILIFTYWPALTGSFVNYDDPLYLTENQLIQRGLSFQALRWSFTSISVGHWHPMTWISHLVGVEIFGLDPFGHHLINLLLHYANVLLIAMVFRQTTGHCWRSWLVAALFAVHPLNVESTAWIAERKGILGAFFWLLAVYAYIRYVKTPTWQRYLLVMLFFILGLSSKALVVTLPCGLLLLDFWPLERFRLTLAPESRQQLLRIVTEKIPFLLPSMTLGAVAIYAMWHGGAASSYPLLPRLGNVINGYIGYIKRLFLPVNLSVSYPFILHPSGWWVAGCLVMLIAATLFIVLWREKLPYLFTGWFWYLVTLVPVIGFLNLNLGQQTMPDRYAYLPLIGLMIMVVWGVDELCDRLHVAKPFRLAAACFAIITLGILTARQTSYWHDSTSLFAHEVDLNPASVLAHNNLGCALAEAGELYSAFDEFNKALQLDPNYRDAWNNLGLCYEKAGQHSEAIDSYRQAIAIDPLHVKAHYNLGMALIGRNDMEGAWKEYRILKNINPEQAEKMEQFQGQEPPWK